jgi:hypothetical protein
MLLVALTMLLQAASPAGAEIDDDGMITVTARRIDDLAADVAACAAAPCPTRRDVAVSVAYASALFNEGRYRDAKDVVNAAVARVRGAAGAEPIAVSQLYSAQATIYRHYGDTSYGDTNLVGRATRNSYTVLRDHLGPNALHTLTAEYRLAQWSVRSRRYAEAEAQFERVADLATAAGYLTLASACDLHRAQLLERRREADAGFALLEAVAARDAGPDDDGDMRRAAMATAVRMASERREDRRAEFYAGKLLALGQGHEPLLLSAKPLPTPQTEVYGWRWVDIGYWIRPDGTVDSVEVLRGTERRDWAAPLLRHIAEQRFTPTQGTFGHYRVERYTMTADLVKLTKYLTRRRVANARFEMTPMQASSAAPS